MIGIELVSDRETKEPLTEKAILDVLLDLAALELLVYCRRSILGLLPPLIIDDAIDRALGTRMKANIARKARLARDFASSKLG